MASGILDLRGLTPSSRQTLQAGLKSATIKTLAQMQFDKPISFVFGKELGAVWVLQHVTTSPSSWDLVVESSLPKPQKKNGKTGMLGQDRLEVRWEAVMFLFNVVNLNVWLFLFDYLAKCVVEVVVIMFGLNEGDNCWGGQSFYV